MQLDESIIKYNQIFLPGLLEAMLDVVQNNRRFAYYTGAETAMKVIRNGELWFRNAMVMNDFSEIAYGLNLIRKVFSGPQGDRFRKAVNDIFPEVMEKVDASFTEWNADWELETYIACVSLHDDSEDQSGRLSMWRAYGDTALIVNNTPMTAVTDLLGVFSVPVSYLDEAGLDAKLSGIVDEILKNRTYLMELGPDVLVGYMHHMLFNIAIATKHPGFAEEKEWRLFFRPNERQSPGMRCETVVVGGVPQNIWALSLVDDPDNGLHGAAIPSLLDRLIVGPTEHPYVCGQAFRRILSDVGVADVGKKVFVSDIPLRTG
ncbi:DUF2971 domain-containing protein [Heliomarina baculiformis]|uniref:DUF2971 domain-containing protein n=1 Tax=Heliomarina baculiformis TaxID=2872036 RepID=UPI001EE298C4|nr:DUF2971 domain-containing protein [Heliomarina baculiformis]